MKNESTRKIINVDKCNYSPIWTYKQEDDGVLKLALFKGSTLLDITGQTIKLGAKRPDNSIIELTNGFKINKNELDIILKNNILAIPGIVECDLEITDAGGKMTTASFYLTINKKITGKDNLDASNDISAINKIVAEVLAIGKELDGNIKVVVEEANKKITAIDTALNKKLNEMQEDYDSLQKIIIDENQAANLQAQINKSNEQLDNIANKGTTVEVLERVTKEEIDRQIADGTIANLTIAPGNITKEKIADKAVGIRHISFFEDININPFDNPDTVIGEKITHTSTYATEKNDLYIISSEIELINATTDIKLYAYDRIAFFDENRQFTSALSLYGEDVNKTDFTIIMSNYPVLANAKFIKVCIKKEQLKDMYIKQGDESLMHNNSITFKALELTQKQIDEALDKASEKSISFSSIKDVKTEKTEGMDMKDGYKIAGQHDDHFIRGEFNLVAKDDATTTVFIPVNANDNSIWEFRNVSRISFFGTEETYIDSLYDEWHDLKPPSSIKISEQFPTLRNIKGVRLSIKLSNKSDWSLKIDGVEYFKPASGTKYYIKDLIIKNDNLSENIKAKLAKVDDITKDNSFKYHKDTTIVFKKNKDFASTHFRIPFMCVTNLGTIIAGCDIRYNTWNDHSLIDIGTARSEDGGKTWIDKTVAIPNPGVSSTLSRVMDGTILATKEGRVFLIGNKFNTDSTGWTQVNTPNDPNWDCVLYHSDDDGRTWQFNQSLKGLLPQGQISFLGGVGSGIQMKDGTLVFPIQMARYNDKPFNAQSGIIYSKDNGSTWKMSETLIPEYTSECSVVEYPTGTIIINCRQEGQNHRSVFKTTNFGTTWEETPMNTGTQQTNTCQGHMCKIKVGFNKEVILFTNPINDGSNRQDGAYANYDRSNLSLSILQNDTKFTPIHTLYRPHSDGYSCMAFDERRNRLYIVMELEHNLVFRDITDLLPIIQLYKNLEV